MRVFTKIDEECVCVREEESQKKSLTTKNALFLFICIVVVKIAGSEEYSRLKSTASPRRWFCVMAYIERFVQGNIAQSTPVCVYVGIVLDSRQRNTKYAHHQPWASDTFIILWAAT